MLLLLTLMIHAIFLAAFLIGQIEFLYFSSEHQCSFVFEVLSKSLSHRLKVQRAEISNKAILFPFVQFAVFYNGIDLSLGWEFGTKFDFKVEQNSFQLLPKSFCICFLPPRIGVTLSHPNLYCWLPWYQMIYPSHGSHRGVQRWSIYHVSPTLKSEIKK